MIITANYDFLIKEICRRLNIKNLIEKAKTKNARLLTTEKDWVRLPDWAKKEIRFSKLNTEIDGNFYDWLKEKINDVHNKKN